MESLTKEQTECYEKIASIKRNYKKDGNKRKTQKYFETRLYRLESLWGEFVQRDIDIGKLKQANLEHSYFAKKYFDEVENYYEDLKDLLQKHMDEVIQKEKQSDESTVQKGNEDEEDNYYSKLVRIQKETIKMLERSIESIQKEIGDARSPFYYQHKLTTIQSYWDKIWLNHNEIIANSNEVSSEYLAQCNYHALEATYDNIVITLQEQLGTTQRTDEEVKLPRLVLPIFEGDYEHWTSFHDIFVRLIHNNARLGEAEKMQYLKTHLRKEASSLLQHLTISDANYKTAWKLLNDRFNNKRKICATQLQILLSQPKLDQESAIGVRKLHDTTRECLHALTNLGIDTTSWAPLVTHVIIQKLDLESHKLFEQTLEKPRELPTHEGLFRFLETRFQSLESLKDSKKKEGCSPSRQSKGIRYLEHPRYKTYHTTTAKPHKCSYCQQPHKIYQCQKFLRLSAQGRKQYISSRKLCINCLTHKEEETCNSRFSCSICQRHHHTLLHIGAEKPRPAPAHTTAHLSTSEDNETTRVKPRILAGDQNRQVILATALLKARVADGRI